MVKLMNYNHHGTQMAMFLVSLGLPVYYGTSIILYLIKLLRKAGRSTTNIHAGHKLKPFLCYQISCLCLDNVCLIYMLVYYADNSVCLKVFV